jgi:dihydroorotase
MFNVRKMPLGGVILSGHSHSAMLTQEDIKPSLVDEENMPLAQLIARLTQLPAKILGIKAGSLAVGQSADVCIFDPHRHWTVSKDNILSKGRNTPFTGWELASIVTHTLFKGELVYSLD